LAQVYLNDLNEIEKAFYHYKKSIAVNPSHPRVAALKKGGDFGENSTPLPNPNRLGSGLWWLYLDLS